MRGVQKRLLALAMPRSSPKPPARLLHRGGSGNYNGDLVTEKEGPHHGGPRLRRLEDHIEIRGEATSILSEEDTV
jgi:hypothetical protein